MTDKRAAFISGMLGGSGLALILSSILFGREIDTIKAEAIERRFAQYNSVSGLWEWKRPVQGTTNDK